MGAAALPFSLAFGGRHHVTDPWVVGSSPNPSLEPVLDVISLPEYRFDKIAVPNVCALNWPLRVLSP